MHINNMPSGQNKIHDTSYPLPPEPPQCHCKDTLTIGKSNPGLIVYQLYIKVHRGRNLVGIQLVLWVLVNPIPFEPLNKIPGLATFQYCPFDPKVCFECLLGTIRIVFICILLEVIHHWWVLIELLGWVSNQAIIHLSSNQVSGNMLLSSPFIITMFGPALCKGFDIAVFWHITVDQN